MLSYRQIKIVSYILSIQDGVSLDSLIKVIGVSEKTVKNEIKEINKILADHETIQYSHRVGYYIEHPSDKFYDLLNISLQNNKEDYIDKDRTSRILMMLIFEKDYVSMETLASKLYLSKSMLNKLMDASWRLRKYIEVSPTKGLRIPWSEEKKRSFLSKFTLDSNAFEIFQQEQEVLELSDILNEIISKCLLDYHYTIAGNALKTFHNYLLITIIRREQGFELIDSVDGVPISKLMKKLCIKLKEKLDIEFSQNELWSCQRKLNELNLISYDRDKDYGESKRQLYSCLQEFKKTIKETFDITIDMNQEIQDNFLLHMHKLRLRIENGNDVSNFNKRDINASYPFTAQIIRDFFLPIFKMDIMDTEIAYIVLYFAQYLEYPKPQHKLLYICDGTPSLIYDTKRKVEHLFSDTVFEIDCIPQYKYLADTSNYNSSYTAIITTEIPVITKNFHILLINRLLFEEDFELLKIYINGCVEHKENNLLQENKNHYLKKEQVIDEKFSTIFEALHNEDIGNVSIYDIVLNSNIGYYASFTKKKSQIKILRLRHPIFYKDRYINKVIVANYNIDDHSAHDFFQVVHNLIAPK